MIGGFHDGFTQTNGTAMTLCVDQSSRPPPSPASLKAAGVAGINHYLSDRGAGYSPTDPITWATKCLRPAEVKAYRAAGLGLWANWETSADAMVNQTDPKARGTEAATNCRKMMNVCGYPSGLPIYFSLDVDPRGFTASQWAAVDGFLDGAAGVLGRSGVGLYGAHEAVKRSFDSGRIRWGWQTRGWSTYKLPDGSSTVYWDDRAQLRQFPDRVAYLYPDGVQCDVDRAMVANYGQWGNGQEDPMSATGPASWDTADWNALLVNGGYPVIRWLDHGNTQTGSGDHHHAIRADVATLGQAVKDGVAYLDGRLDAGLKVTLDLSGATSEQLDQLAALIAGHVVVKGVSYEGIITLDPKAPA